MIGNIKMVDLSAYAGDVVKIRILGRKTGSGALADIAIDDLMIYNRPATRCGRESIVTSVR